jgi:signal transduction histidine kinase
MLQVPAAAVPLIEERFRCLDGTTVDVEVIVTAALYQGRPAVQVVARDISGRKRSEEALRGANRQLNLLNSVTRHDILNKVMAISGCLELLKRERLDPKTADLVRILENTNRSIGEHIEFTRIYQDLGSMEAHWQDLARALPHCTHIPEGILLQADVDGVEVYADPMLEKIFLNLLDNTLRHGIHTTTIRVYACHHPGGLVVTWEDNGIGIPLREKERFSSGGTGQTPALVSFWPGKSFPSPGSPSARPVSRAGVHASR